MDPSIYIALLVFGILYWISAFSVELELLVGEVGLGIPYATTLWGIMGIVGYEEPIPALSAITVYLFAFGLYLFLEQQYKLADEILLKKGTVTISIHPDNKGEIMIRQDYGNQHYIARADNIIKPIPKGEKVFVTKVEDNVAIVEQEFPSKVERKDISAFRSMLFNLRRIITPSRTISAICVVCFGTIKQTKGALKCPSCGSYGHREHLLTWLENRSLCPNCKSRLEWDGYELSIET